MGVEVGASVAACGHVVAAPRRKQLAGGVAGTVAAWKGSAARTFRAGSHHQTFLRPYRSQVSSSNKPELGFVPQVWR